jgi:hypothetical protein
MKKTFAILLGLSIVGAFFTVASQTAEGAVRFRGSSRYYQSMDNYSAIRKQTRLPRYSSRRRLTPMNWSVIEKKNKAAKQTPSRRSSTRYRGGAFSSTSGTNVIVQSRRVASDELQSFTAKNIDFKISLPEGFSVISDTIDETSGEFIFQKGSARIKLVATAERCDAGVNYCLKAKSDTALEAFQELLPEMVMRKNKNISLDSTQVQLKKNNMGRFVDLYARDYGAGQLTFFAPNTENVWILTITDPEHGEGLLKNDRDLYKIFASLTQKSAVSGKSTRTILSSLFGARNRSAGRNIQNKVSEIFGKNDLQAFVAENVPFHIEMPNRFELISDTLERSSGEMLFENEEETLLITATEAVCDEQTPRLLRRCIDAQAAVLLKELQLEFPNANILQNDNMQVQLTDVSSSGQNLRRASTFKSHIGKIVMLRKKGQRMGYFVFAEPETGFVWKIKMTAPEDSNAFLNNIRQKTKIINSLFFESE